MAISIQDNYEQRLDRYATLIHGNEPVGLVPKLALYSALLDQHRQYGDRLLKIEALLVPITQAVEVDLHLATAKLLEHGRRGERSLFSFLEFCLTNRKSIRWLQGTPSQAILEGQLKALESHRPTIDMIMGRRDKFFAHLDKQYFNEPSTVFADFPLSESDVIALVNCMIGIVSEHQWSLRNAGNFHIAEVYPIAVDNMVRNLEAGRRVNFPGQL